MKQARGVKHEQVENVLLTWFEEIKVAGVNVDGSVLREKVDNIALSLGIEALAETTGELGGLSPLRCFQERALPPPYSPKCHYQFHYQLTFL